jgi:hypothetical protein
MNWLRKKMLDWLNGNRGKYPAPEAIRNGTTLGSQAPTNSPQIQLIKALNGTVLHMQTVKPRAKPQDDYTLEVSYYVLKEGDSLPDAVAALLVNHKLDRL